MSAPTKTIARPKVRPGWAMGLMTLLTFFGLAVTLAFALDLAIKRGLREVATSTQGALNLEMSGRVNADIIIGGSSRAMASYQPDILQGATGRSVFDIGQNSTRTDFQLAFLKAYLRHNEKPRVLLQNVDFHTFGLSREIAYPATYEPYLKEPEIYEAMRAVDPQVWRWKYLPLYCFAVEDDQLTWLTGAARLLGRNPKEDLIRGYSPRYTTFSSEFDDWRKGHPHGEPSDLDAGGVQVVADMLALCQQQNIKVILVFAPVYCELNPLISNRGEIFDDFRRLSAQYHAEFWDYSKDPMTKDKAFFSNSQHVNHLGAEAFSRELGQRLAVYLASNPSSPDAHAASPDAHPASLGAHPAFADVRPSSLGARPAFADVRPSSLGARPAFAEARGAAEAAPGKQLSANGANP